MSTVKTPVELAFAAWLEPRALRLDDTDPTGHIGYYVVAETAFQGGYAAALASGEVVQVAEALEQTRTVIRTVLADTVALLQTCLSQGTTTEVSPTDEEWRRLERAARDAEIPLAMGCGRRVWTLTERRENTRILKELRDALDALRAHRHD